MLLVRLFRIEWGYARDEEGNFLKDEDGLLYNECRLNCMLYGHSIVLTDKMIPLLKESGAYLPYLVSQYLRNEKGLLVTGMCPKGEFLMCDDVRHGKTLKGYRSELLDLTAEEKE